MLSELQAKRFNIFADVIAIILTFSIFIPLIEISVTVQIILGHVGWILLVISFVIKRAVYKQAKDDNWVAQLCALVFGGMAILAFLFW